MENEEIKTIPFIVYEISETKHETRERHLFCIISMLALLLFASNMLWLYVAQSYDTVSTVTVDGKDGTALYQDGKGNTLNNGIGGESEN